MEYQNGSVHTCFLTSKIVLVDTASRLVMVQDFSEMGMTNLATTTLEQIVADTFISRRYA